MLGQRATLLSQICEKFSANELMKMSPFITRHLLQMARNLKNDLGAGMAVKARQIVRHKLNFDKVQHFFSWLMTKGRPNIQ